MGKQQNLFRALVLIGLFITLSKISYSQSLDQTLDKYLNFQKLNPKERIFVHTDKANYLTGERIWLKVYYQGPVDPVSGGLSKIAYIEVLNNENAPVAQVIIAISGQSGSGSMTLPASLDNGNYVLRAYTNWMKNSGPAIFFVKPITVINPMQNVATKVLQDKLTYDIQFFPEGGQLVAGVNTKVGYKAVGSDGKGIALDGVIINQRSDTIAKFSEQRFGIGNFYMLPEVGDQYRSIVRVGKDNLIIKDLPPVIQAGFGLNARQLGTGDYEIRTVNSISAEDMYMIVHNGKKVSHAQAVKFVPGGSVFQIPALKLADGVNQITLFNIVGVPVAERKIFKRPEAKLYLEGSLASTTYSPRSPVNLDLISRDNIGRPVEADLSASVYRLDSIQLEDKADIISYFWLGSALKGMIESPEFYMSNTSESANRALDNLMLTHGWTMFNWDNVSASPAMSYLPEHVGATISGLIKDAAGNPLPNVFTYFGVPGKDITVNAALTDQAGRFSFVGNKLYGNRELAIQSPQLNPGARVELNSPFSGQFENFNLNKFNFQPQMLGALQQNHSGATLYNAYFDTRASLAAVPESKDPFFGKFYKTYVLKDYTQFNTMPEIFVEYIREVVLLRANRDAQLRMFSAKEQLNPNPLVLLDGMPVLRIDSVMSIDPLLIERINIYRERYYHGPAVWEGIVDIRSYKGDLGATELDAKALYIDYAGINNQKEFYAPSYAAEGTKASRLPDFRNVLHWSPSVKVGNTGKGSVSFYTSDRPGNYFGTIQGVSVGGVPGYKSFYFTVR